MGNDSEARELTQHQKDYARLHAEPIEYARGHWYTTEQVVRRIIDWVGGQADDRNVELLTGFANGVACVAASDRNLATHRMRARWHIADRKLSHDWGYIAGLRVGREKRKGASRKAFERGVQEGLRRAAASNPLTMRIPETNLEPFFEEDEPVADVVAKFNEAEKGLTGKPFEGTATYGNAVLLSPYAQTTTETEVRHA